MILNWLPLSIVLDVLSCTETKMFKMPRKGCFIKEKGTAIVLWLRASCLGSFKLFPFMVLIFILLHVLPFIFHFSWFSEVFGVLGGCFRFFLGGRRAFLFFGVFRKVP